MKIGFHIRSNIQKWGGDLGVIYSLKSCMEQLGHEVLLSSSLFDLLETDRLFLTNSCFDLRSDCELLEALGKPCSLIPFHEDFLSWQPLASGFTDCIRSGHDLRHLEEHPDVAFYFSQMAKPTPLYNKEALASAQICIANSEAEAKVIRRDSPTAKTAVIKWGIDTPAVGDDSFLKWTGLSSRSYLLQVGRIQTRKNQLASILSARNLDIPLVFIATESFEKGYEELCIDSAMKWRKAPTLFISQTLPAMENGSVRIIPMPEGKKLSKELLSSAFQHAALYLHPAFQELPGLVFLEAAFFGLPIVASIHCTIHEYLKSPSIRFPRPHDLKAIEEEVVQLLGKRFPPTLSRSSLEMAQDVLALIVNDAALRIDGDKLPFRKLG